MAKQKLNKLQQAQLLDSIKAGSTVTVNRPPASMKKGYSDTPLFLSVSEDKQQKLF